MAMLPHRLFMCLQHACSAGLRCAFGTAQTMVGASNGRKIANTNANWRIVLMELQLYNGTQNTTNVGRPYSAIERGLGLVSGPLRITAPPSEHHDQPFEADDFGIDQVALEKRVVLHGEWDHNRRKPRALE